MVKAQKKKCVLSYILLIFLTFVSGSGAVQVSYALSREKLNEFSQINALFWEPDETLERVELCKGAGYKNEISWVDLNSIGTGWDTAGERLRLIVENYGEFAMNLQRYYGVPWEMIFGIMVEESGVGVDLYSSDSDPSTWNPSKKAKEAGMFEMMGLVDAGDWFNTDVKTHILMEDNYSDSTQDSSSCTESGDCGVESGSGVQTHSFKNYPTISRMMLGYVVYHVGSGKNDNYKMGLELLTPENYSSNLREAVRLIMKPYCASESGDCYSDDLYDIIMGTNDWGRIIKGVAEKNGWPSSTELAMQENLPAGGYTRKEWGFEDIRQRAWDAYGVYGLPLEVAKKIGVIGEKCEEGPGGGPRARGDCSQFNIPERNGGCTEDGFAYFYQSNGHTYFAELGMREKSAEWAWESYAGGVIGDSACSPTAFAMIVTAFRGEYFSPLDIVNKIKEKDGDDPSGWKIQINGIGTDAGAMLDGLAGDYGLRYEWIMRPELSVDEINGYLDEGDIVLAGIGGASLTYYDEDDQEHSGTISTDGKGHFIAIRARDDNGRWRFFDSGGWSGDRRNFLKYNPGSVVNAVLERYYRKDKDGKPIRSGGAWRIYK